MSSNTDVYASLLKKVQNEASVNNVFESNKDVFKNNSNDLREIKIMNGMLDKIYNSESPNEFNKRQSDSLIQNSILKKQYTCSNDAKLLDEENSALDIVSENSLEIKNMNLYNNINFNLDKDTAMKYIEYRMLNLRLLKVQLCYIIVLYRYRDEAYKCANRKMSKNIGDMQNSINVISQLSKGKQDAYDYIKNNVYTGHVDDEHLERIQSVLCNYMRFTSRIKEIIVKENIHK
jgi:hypothetical protein|tara:strand:- start:93 stop:791 length:699 start_codon:yes stop_codon:yes gene_type:complete